MYLCRGEELDDSPGTYRVATCQASNDDATCGLDYVVLKPARTVYTNMVELGTAMYIGFRNRDGSTGWLQHVKSKMASSSEGSLDLILSPIFSTESAFVIKTSQVPPAASAPIARTSPDGIRCDVRRLMLVGSCSPIAPRFRHSSVDPPPAACACDECDGCQRKCRRRPR